MPAKRPEILTTLSEDGSRPLFQQIYDSLRDQILNGTLREGDKVPSIRSLTKDLGVSHATVERAYQQLALEGYVQNVPRSGFVVTHIDIDYFTEASLKNCLDQGKEDLMPASSEFREECQRVDEALYNFAYTSLKAGSFPRRLWAKLYAEVLADMADEDLVNYYHSEEPCLLQVQVAHYLQRARGVRCRPSQVILMPGTESVLSSLMQLFLKLDGLFVLGHEVPGFDVMTAVAQRFQIPMVPLPVEKGSGKYMCAVRRQNPHLVFATPSHQFPTGAMMDVDTRVELLRWAEKQRAYIIEDDSCNEYRYETRAIPSLQSLDHNDRVIYVGNFSKALSPGLRLAYVVLPPRLLKEWGKLFTFSSDAVPYISREVVGLYMQRGHWDSHLRRMVAGNRRRHDALVAAFDQEFGNRVTLLGKDSGMHLFVEVHNGMTQAQLLESAQAQGATVYGTQRYFWPDKHAPENFVMVGFSAIDREDILPGVQALRRAWFPNE